MKYSSIKTVEFSKSVLDSIKVLMTENDIKEVDLTETIFGENGGWKSIEIVNNDLIINRQPTEYIKQDWYHDFEFVCMIDIINLQKVVYELILKKFAFEAECMDRFETCSFKYN